MSTVYEQQLADADVLKINRNNYNRDLVLIEIDGVIFSEPITEYVQGIEYSDSSTPEFGNSLGTRRPTRVGFPIKESTGTLTLTDAGLDFLVNLAIKNGYPSILELGMINPITITIQYTTFNQTVKTDTLSEVYFGEYNNGVNTDDVLYDREVPMVMGKITAGVIG